MRGIGYIDSRGTSGLVLPVYDVMGVPSMSVCDKDGRVQEFLPVIHYTQCAGIADVDIGDEWVMAVKMRDFVISGTEKSVFEFVKEMPEDQWIGPEDEYREIINA